MSELPDQNLQLPAFLKDPSGGSWWVFEIGSPYISLTGLQPCASAFQKVSIRTPSLYPWCFEKKSRGQFISHNDSIRPWFSWS